MPISHDGLMEFLSLVVIFSEYWLLGGELLGVGCCLCALQVRILGVIWLASSCHVILVA